MNYILICIRDNAIGAFGTIQQVRAQGEALRSFIDAINDPQNKQLNQHPNDFDLYILGAYNDETGGISPSVPPKKIANGFDVQTQ